MAKIYGLFGAMTGKLADTVMSVRNGEQIARKYQPVVFNPQTPAQIAQRAKLKMLSQLSAVMAPVIAIPRQGAVSSRNLFTKKNFPTTSYADDQAEIELTSVQLTNSVVGLPVLIVTRTGSTVTVGLSPNTGLDVDRIVYAAFEKKTDGSVLFIGSQVNSTPGAENTFEATFTANAGDADVVVYAYGVRDNSENARVTFGNLTALSAETIAKLVVNRILTEKDVTLTKTVAAESNPSE